ncbi:MAG: NapC/NirT family cytochrome c [Stellaceae bacterium]
MVVAGVFGVGGIIARVAIDRYTSTDTFCASCHTMAFQADDSFFKYSAHRSNHEGVQASCGDCHIPRNNWFIEIYTHVTSGAKDVFAELTNDFSDIELRKRTGMTSSGKFAPKCTLRTASPVSAVMA